MTSILSNPSPLEIAIAIGLVLFIAACVSSYARRWRRFRQLRREAQALKNERLILARICPNCGYDVRSAHRPGATGNCPECGTPVKTVQQALKDTRW